MFQGYVGILFSFWVSEIYFQVAFAVREPGNNKTFPRFFFRYFHIFVKNVCITEKYSYLKGCCCNGFSCISFAVEIFVPKIRQLSCWDEKSLFTFAGLHVQVVFMDINYVMDLKGRNLITQNYWLTFKCSKFFSLNLAASYFFSLSKKKCTEIPMNSCHFQSLTFLSLWPHLREGGKTRHLP